MNRLKTALLIFLGLLLMTGCNTLGIGIQGPAIHSSGKAYHKPGPPPHAPAHGYRHKNHHGRDLVYDDTIGVYIVANIPETYFGNNLYIRMSTDGQWMVSATLERGWRLAVGNEIPYPLKEYKEKDRKKKSKKEKRGKKHQ